MIYGDAKRLSVYCVLNIFLVFYTFSVNLLSYANYMILWYKDFLQFSGAENVSKLNEVYNNYK